MKTLAAVLLLTVGMGSAYAQEDCGKNSSISHEAVKAQNYKDAYEPCMAVLKDCPTLRYYTYSDAFKILQNFLQTTTDRSSADYQKYFDELMQVHDLRIQHIPDFLAKGTKLSITTDGALGAKALDYQTYSPNPDLETAYAWLKQSVSADQSAASPNVIYYFLEASQKRVKADINNTQQFFDDYVAAGNYVDEAIAATTDEKKLATLNTTKDNLTALFINSGVADCESLQEIYGPKVQENANDSTFLKQAIAVLKMLGCKENEAYFAASEALYRIKPTADAAVGVAYMYYKRGDYDQAVTYFDEALSKETDNDKKAEMAVATAAALFSAKKLTQARNYCHKAISYKADYGYPYILIAQIYASSPKWSDESALNKCTYYLAIDKLQKAKSIDPEVAEEANKLISTYSAYTPQAQDLFMLGYKAGDRVTIGGWIGETTTIR